MQAKSRAYATEQIAQQMVDFKRLGVLGDWDDPYRTMDFGNEAGEIRALKRMIERGFVYRGLKPVYWCFDCGSSLAEFEIEYADKKSPTVDVAFPLRRAGEARARAFGLAVAGQGRLRRHLDDDAVDASRPTRRSTCNPELDYALVDTERGLLILAERAGRRLPGSATASNGTVLATAPRRERSTGLRLPPSAGRASTPATTALRRSTWPTT